LFGKLTAEISTLPLPALRHVIRGCGHYLNLTGIAEQNHMLRTQRGHGTWSMSCDTVFTHLLSSGVDPAALHDAVSRQKVEIVLTAHPTQVNRRTLQYKFQRIAHFLERYNRADLTTDEKDLCVEDLARELQSLWQTDELRRRRPTPLDEARGGLHVVEQSLWTAVPAHLRRLSMSLKKHTGQPLPLEAAPMTFASWMGGDRDGNPNVTARVTHHVACLSRWMAADLYMHEIDALRFELSMGRATPELCALARLIEKHEDATYKELHKPTVGGGAPADAVTATAATNGGAANTGASPDRGGLPVANTNVGASATGTSPGAGGGTATTPVLTRTLTRRLTMSGGVEGVASDAHHIGSGSDAGGHQLLPSGMVVPTLTHDGFNSDAVHVPYAAVESDPFTWREIQEHLTADIRASQGNPPSAPTSPHKVGIASQGGSAAPASPPPAAAQGLVTPGLAKIRPGKLTAGSDSGLPGSATGSSANLAGMGSASGSNLAGRGSQRSMETLLNPTTMMGETPYRTVLGYVRQKLVATRHRMEDLLAGAGPVVTTINSATDGDASAANVALAHVVDFDKPWFDTPQELIAPLRACYDSLQACGAGNIAEGRLTDVIRRAYSFGLALLKLDVRQEAPRHTEALDAITTYLGLGSYAAWPEDQRLRWLSAELSGRRPLVPHTMPVTPAVREVLETFRVVAELGRQSLGAYVISMCGSASDVLAVELLQREARAVVAAELEALHAMAAGSAQKESVPPHSDPQHGHGGSCFASYGTRDGPLRVVPLFETLKDLENAPAVMEALFNVPWYRNHLTTCHAAHQEIMLGYSDSGKDAGRLAAAWALYVCQEKLVDVCKKHDVALTLFHGRGGSIGRGGGPMHLAIQSQPPGSVHGSLRVTEQGEMVTAKFGLILIAQRQLEIFSTAVLLATLAPHKAPASKVPACTVAPEWRVLMDELGRVSCNAYRDLVVRNADFLRYFSEATPESELGNLNIGSRPARRGVPGAARDIASMRAIPWLFAWTQSRSVLPAWLGVGAALASAIRGGKLTLLRDMYERWPFFQSTLDLVEMVLTKADMRIQGVYEDKLCSCDATRAVGAFLREAYAEAVHSVLAVTGHSGLSEASPLLRRLIDARSPYVCVINLAQAEVLRRLRADDGNTELRDSLLISINGIAAGMRNTG